MKRACLLGAIALLFFGLAQITSAQNSGAITGTVVDQKGGVIVGASVKAVDESKGIVMAEATTGTEGTFTLQPLQPGTYTVRVSANGMRELEQKGIVLDSRQVLGLGQLRMTVGAASESVTVEATTPLVETATSDHAAVIDSRQVTEISMNGRDFQSLVRTLPGVVSNDSSDFRLAFNNTDSFHVDGLRGSDNNVFLDGAINTNHGIAGRHWVSFELAGTRSNRLAIGAKVKIVAGGVTQTEEIHSGGSYLSQNDLRVHFGLNKTTRIDSVEIRWPSGSLDRVKDLAVDRFYAVLEGKGIVPPEQIRPAKKP